MAGPCSKDPPLTWIFLSILTIRPDTGFITLALIATEKGRVVAKTAWDQILEAFNDVNRKFNQARQRMLHMERPELDEYAVILDHIETLGQYADKLNGAIGADTLHTTS